MTALKADKWCGSFWEDRTNVAYATYEDLLSEYPDFSIDSYRNNRHIFDGKVIREFENAFDELMFEYNKNK